MTTKILGLVLAASALSACGSSKPSTETTTPTNNEAPADQAAAADGVADEAEAPDAPLPALPTTPQQAPDALLATIHLGDPATTLVALGDFVNGVKPGAGAMLQPAALIGIASTQGIDLTGIDLGKPTRVLVLDPAVASPPVVAVVSVADQPALEAAVAKLGLRIQIRDGIAAIGPRAALAAAGGYAMTTLLAAPMPALPTAEIRVPTLLARYGGMLDVVAKSAGDSAATPQARQSLETSFAMFSALLRQMQQLDLALEVGAERASLINRVVPIAGTTLASFAAAQTPGSFALLERLPEGQFAMGGRLDFSTVMPALKALYAPMMTEMYGDRVDAVNAYWDIWASFSGEHALSGSKVGESVNASGVFESNAAIQGAWKTFLDNLAQALPAKGGPAAVEIKVKAGGVRYRGATLTEMSFVPSKTATAEQRAAYDAMGQGKLTIVSGVVDSFMLMTFGTDAVGKSKALVDVLKVKKAKPDLRDSYRSGVLANARQRGESSLFLLDVAAMIPELGDKPAKPAKGAKAKAKAKRPKALEPLVMAFGASPSAMTVRITVPSAQVHAWSEIEKAEKPATP